MNQKNSSASEKGADFAEYGLFQKLLPLEKSPRNCLQQDE
jgi:hypothetical protein